MKRLDDFRIRSKGILLGKKVRKSNVSVLPICRSILSAMPVIGYNNADTLDGSDK